MDSWYFTLFFIFSLLVVIKNLFSFILRLLAIDPTEYVLNEKELMFLGGCISYTITYLIY